MNLEEALIVILLILAVTGWTRRPLLALVQKLKRKNVRHERPAQKFFDELKAPKVSAPTASPNNGRLPALISESKSSPSEFECTLARTIINGFAGLYELHNVDQLMKTVEDFYLEVSHIVSRYDGIIHEFRGDEVIFYIKDRTEISSTVLALGALREINAAASRIDASTLNERGYRFTLKSSLAHGRIRYGRLVKSDSIVGLALSETARILNHVDEKNESTVHFAHRHLDKLNPYFLFEEAKAVRLKGYEDDALVFRYLAHVPLETIWTQAILDPSVLVGFRSTDDVCFILRKLATEPPSTEQHLGIITILRSMPSTRFEVKIWRALLEMLTSFIDVDRVANVNRALSSALMLSINLVRSTDQNQVRDIIPVLQSCLSSLDGRVVANAVEVLLHLGIETEDEAMGSLLAHPTVRVVANTLIYQSHRELHRETRARLSKMLKSKDASLVASAAFALGEISRIQRENDAVSIETSIEVDALLKLMPPAFSEIDDPMPRRQILFAAYKSARSELIDELDSRAKHVGFTLSTTSANAPAA